MNIRKMFGKKRRELVYLQKIANTQVIVRWVNPSETTKPYDILDVNMESLCLIWKFGGYGQEWYNGIHLGGGSYLTMEPKE